MNVHQLRHLVAVTECGSASAAACSLCLSQPVVSQAVQVFEVTAPLVELARSDLGAD